MADSAQPQDPAKKPKTKGIIRWFNVIVIVAAVLGFAFFNGPLTKKYVKKYGTAAIGSEVDVDSATLDIFGMQLTIKGLRVADAADAKKDQFKADEVSAKLEPLSLLKGQLVIAEAVVKKPRGRLVRHADGSIGQPEKKPEGTDDSTWEKHKKELEEAAKKRDLVEDLKNMMKKLKEKRDAQVAEKEKQKKEREEAARTGAPTKEEIDQGKADWVREHRPLVVVRHLVADDVEVSVEDSASGAPAQTITDATLEVREWSTSPSLHDQPMQVELKGANGKPYATLSGSPGSEVGFKGTIDTRSEESKTSVNAHLANVALAPLDALYRQAVPVAFQGHSVGTLDLPLNFQGWNIDWTPALLLDKIEAKARDPNQQIAGLQASKVAEELTNAQQLPLQNIHIHGPIWSPTVDGLDDTLKQLVIQGGKNYAMKKGKEMLQGQVDKALEKNPEAKKKLEQAEKMLPGGVGQSIGNTLGIGGSSTGNSTGSSTAQPPANEKKAPTKDSIGGAIKDAEGIGGGLFGGKK